MVTTEEECIAAAERIGYPVMLKASEGGGGKGIRMSKDAAELRNNWRDTFEEQTKKFDEKAVAKAEKNMLGCLDDFERVWLRNGEKR